VDEMNKGETPEEEGDGKTEGADEEGTEGEEDAPEGAQEEADAPDEDPKEGGAA
jgi:hypothetical protein